jgi:hypothetical protein
MRTPLRLGAVIALGALLLVGMLASPALAWDWGVKAEAVCEESGTTARVDFTVTSNEEGAEGDVLVILFVDEEPFGEPVEGQFGPDNDTVEGSFTGVPLDAESVVVKAFVLWKDQKEPEKRKAYPELPTDCETPPSSSSTTTTTTTAPPPESSIGEETSTTAGEGALPFTGNSSGPMLLASIGLVGGGFVILWVSRTRGRHAAK